MRPVNYFLTSLVIFFIITFFAQPAFSSFTKLDSSGNALPDNAQYWVMVKDNNTGLIWEVKQTSNGSPDYNNPHDPDNIYTWYDSNPTTNGGDAGTSGVLTDTEDFIAAVNNNRLGGFTDWRMPTKDELVTILKSDVPAPPTIDTTYFNNTIPGYYWTSTTFPNSTDSAFKVDFYSATEGYHAKSGQYHARAVRSAGIIMLPNSLMVYIYPQPAIDLGALWRVDGGSWQNSGATVSNLSNANHFLEFYDISGWITPPSRNVAIVNGQPVIETGVYTQQSAFLGSLNVSILPQEAVNNGALWRINGGDWQTSGSTVQNLQHGDYTVEFYPILGWTTPPNQNVTIQDGQIAILTGTYTYSSSDIIPPLPINENDDQPLPEDTKPNDTDDIKDIQTDIENTRNQSQAEDITNHLDNDVTFIQENMPDDENTTPSNGLIDAINRTIDNVGAIIEQSFILLKQDIIDIDQALKPLNLLEDIIDLGAATAKTGGEINIEKVAGSLEYVESTINEIISNNAASEQIKKGSDNINNILGNIPDVMNAVKVTKDVITILSPIKGVIGAGIISAIKCNNNPSKPINTIGDIVNKGLQEAQDATLISNTGEIIKGAAYIVNNAVNVLQQNITDNNIFQNTLDVLQGQLSEIIGQTSSNIKDKPVKNRSLSNSFAATTKSSDISSLDDFSYLMDNVSLLTTSMIKAKAVIKSSLTGTMQSLSRETIKNILPAFIYRISTTRDTNIERDSDIQKFLTNYPQLLNEVIKIGSVNLTEGMVITKTDIEQIIADNQSLTAKEKERLINGLPQMPRFDQDIIQSGIDTLSLVDLLQKAVDTLFQQDPLFQGTKVELVSTKSIQIMVMLKNPAIGLNMPLYVQDARLVSSLIPQGLHILPEGTIVLVRNGIAGIITPAPLDAVDTLLSADSLLNLDTIFSSAKKEVSDAKVDNNGTLNLKFKDGSKFSGSFGYGTVKEGDGNFDAGTSSFELHGRDPASEAYSVLVVYNDGSTQQLSPSVSALEQLVIVLDTLAAGSYSLDRTTGIFTVLGMPFKPSYLIEPITTNEQSWFRANKDQYGIAWETNDYNGDGAVDLKMWTADGKQVIYTVIQ